MKLKIIKNKVIVTAIVFCTLLAAWLYGSNAPEKTVVPGPAPVAAIGIAGGEEERGMVEDALNTPDAFPAVYGVSPGAIASSLPKVPPMDVAIQTADPEETTAGGTTGDQFAEKKSRLTAAGDTLSDPKKMGEQPTGRETGAEERSGAAGKNQGENRTAGDLNEKNVADSANSNLPTGRDHVNVPGDPGKEAVPSARQETVVSAERELGCRLSVTCATIFDNMNRFNRAKLEVLPANGVIYPPRGIVFYEGESPFDVLQREMKKHKIHLAFTIMPLYNSHYIEGINNIYEFDCGELSGWICKINDCILSYGSSHYLLQDGDVVEWLYTCNLGHDLAEKCPEGENP